MAVPNSRAMTRRPTHPGEMLREDFLPDYDLTVSGLAEAAGVSRQSVNELLRGRRAVSPDMALRLSRLFGIESAANGHLHVFVIGTGSASLGLAVDRIVGQREIVVRTVADPLVRVEGISGATDLGDGRVVLILDPATLARLSKQRAARVLGDRAAWGRVRT